MTPEPLTPEHDISSERLAELRADTRGVEGRVHLNNAGAALMPSSVVREVVQHIELEEAIGGYEAEDARGADLERVYAALATLLDSTPRNVAITENSTAGFALALSSVAFREGDVLLTTRHDYASNQIQYLSLADRFGVEVVRAPDAPDGRVDPDAVRELIHRRRPRLVAVTHIPTNDGLVQDVDAIGAACRERDALFLVDACQSVGQMPVHPESIGADFLTASARKFLRGPRGVGFLYISNRALDLGLEPLFPDLRGADWVADDLYQPAPDARRFENWEFAHAVVLGLGEAARYAVDVGLEAARERSWGLAAALRERLREVDGVRVLGRADVMGAIVTVAVAGREPTALVRALRGRGINTSSLSRVSAVLDFDALGVEGALRISPHYYNTEDELDAFVAALDDLTRS